MSIGADLAEARRQAGLTVAQVSQQTRIRETIIRGIERDDYAACGGDFYARGHVRAIARAVGTDPGPLIRAYDASHPAQQAVGAADVFATARPVRISERRRLNWAVVLVVTLAAGGLAVAAYYFLPLSGHAPPAAAGSHRASHGAQASPAQASSAAPSPQPTATPAVNPYAHRVTVRLTATEDCWVGFTTPDGRYLSQAYIVAGATKGWTFRQAVDMRIGNPGGVRLTVDGRNPLRPGATGPVTLSLGLGGRISQ